MHISNSIMCVYIYIVQAGLGTGICLAIILCLGFPSMAKLFTTDAQVLDLITSGVLVCMYVYDTSLKKVQDSSSSSYSV